MPARLLQNSSFIVLCLFLLFASCTKQEPITYYKKPATGKLDPTFAWLYELNNSYKPNFTVVFYKYYNQLIKENKIEKAARVLEVVCSRKARNLSYDTEFTNTVKTFAAKYKAKLPVNKTLFINTFFSDLYEAKGEYKTAISYALKTIEVEVTDYTSCKEKAFAYSDLAFYFFTIGNQNLAVKYNFKALELYKKLDTASGPGTVYSNLASIYYSYNDYSNALLYYDKALKCYKKGNDLDNTFIALENKIIVYQDSKNDKLNALVDSTYHAFNRSKIQSDDIKIYIYCFYITKLIKENKLQEAKKIINEIEPIVQKINNIYTDTEFDGVLFDYKIKNNEKIDTKLLVKKLIPHLIKNKNYQRLQTYYLALKDYAIKKQDYKSALMYEEKLNETRNLLGNNQNSNKVIELDKKYQTEKKTQQIATQEKEIATKNATIAWLAFLLLAVFIIVVIYQNRQKQKKLQQDNLSAQLYTKQLLEKVEEERKRIASDLHDSVSHELLGLKNGNNANQQASNQKIDAIINDIRSISRNLHPIMFDKIGLKASVEQLLERAQSVNDFMVTAEIEYQGSLDNSDELQLYRIIQEALSNVIKYAEAMAAKITISEKEKAIYVEIKDNGKGFHVQEIVNGSHSFGLHNIIERSRAIGGEANITSTKNGTTVAIEIKKKQ
ncbi:MAG: hypothetical protein CFE24_13145 [Flavobacterium sp. BFFFF2]|nr:MAG: hypothetical protein CFE24_13145 [Flavobacterium sp. BFFFF2]